MKLQQFVYNVKVVINYQMENARINAIKVNFYKIKKLKDECYDGNSCINNEN